MPADLFNNTIKSCLRCLHCLLLPQDSNNKGLIPENAIIRSRPSIVLLLVASALPLQYKSSVRSPGCGQSSRELRQNPVRRNPGNGLKTQIRTVAAPQVTLWLFDNPGPHGIQMDVASEVQQISL